MTPTEVRRNPDGTARKPQPREPDCIHPFTYEPTVTYQPASACWECKDSEKLLRWVAEWKAWLAENPDSPEARYLERTPVE